LLERAKGDTNHSEERCLYRAHHIVKVTAMIPTSPPALWMRLF
jgi:hypothetical protein